MRGSFVGRLRGDLGDAVLHAHPEHLGHMVPLGRLIGPDVHDDLGILFVLRDQLAFQLGHRGGGAAVTDRSAGSDLDGPDVGLLHLLRGAQLADRRQLQVHALLQQRPCDHEDDQEHEGEVHQRRDVDLVQRDQMIFLGGSAHGVSSCPRHQTPARMAWTQLRREVVHTLFAAALIMDLGLSSHTYLFRKQNHFIIFGAQ